MTPGRSRHRLAVVLALLFPSFAFAQNVNLTIPELRPGATVTITFDVTVDAPAAAGVDEVCNQGSVSGDGFGPLPTDDPDATTSGADPTCTPLVAQPSFTLDKQFSGPTPQPGETVSFDLLYQNAGNQGASGVVVAETVPAGTTSGANPGWERNAPGSGLDCDGEPAGTSCFLAVGGLVGASGLQAATFQVVLDDPLPMGQSTLENTASIEDDDANGGDPFASDTVVIPLDTDAPGVELITTDAGTGDGELGECEEARVAIDRLIVRFDEPMSLAGSSSATSAANYLLVAAGADADVSTLGCGPVAADDVAVALADPGSYDAATDEATFDVAATLPLGDSLYRFFVCGTLEDQAGNPLDGGDSVRTFRVERGNLFANGHFDCDLAGWTAVPPASYNPADADGSALSGSAMVGDMGTPGSVGQCVDLVPEVDHPFSARLRLDAPDGVFATLTADCVFFSQPGCAAGSDFGAAGVSFVVQDTSGAFVPLDAEVATPAGTASALCALGAAASAQAVDLFVDQPFLGAVEIFTDGFESGDTTAWSSTVP